MSNKITQETIEEEIEGSLRDVRPVVRQVAVRHVTDPNEYEVPIQAIFVITLSDDTTIDVGMALPHGYVLMSRSSSSVTPSHSPLLPPSSSRHIDETLNGVLLHHIPAYAAAKQAQIDQQLQQLATQQQQHHQHQQPQDAKHEHEIEIDDADDDGDDSGPSYSDEPLEGY